jgi:hypothetical protein
LNTDRGGAIPRDGLREQSEVRPCVRDWVRHDDLFGIG